MDSVFAIVVLLAIIGYSIYRRNEKTKALSESGLNETASIQGGDYIGGHPNADRQFKAALYQDNTRLTITDMFGRNHIYIPYDSIKDICVEDESQVRYRIGKRRMLMFGIFAASMKKKTVDEKAFLTIEWQDSRFTHETVFQFSGRGAMKQANTARNFVINATQNAPFPHMA